MCNGFVGGHRVIPGTNPLHDIDIVRHGRSIRWFIIYIRHRTPPLFFKLYNVAFCRSVYETRSPVHWSGDTSSLYSIRTSTILRRVSIRFCCSTTTIVWFVAVQFVILFSYYVILIFNQYLDRLLYHRFLLLIKKLQQKNPRPVKIEDL